MDEREIEVVDEKGAKHKLRYRSLHWREAREARDAAFTYKDGLPEYLQPFKYLEEKMSRMLLAVDGVQFRKEMLFEWSEEFGDIVAKAIGVGVTDSSASFRQEA